ncbi:putative two-component response regulator-like APRR6 [Cucurbita maxima]|uniref:Two-component response regulator-like APRR6 n=1 Tax=Cucurbita maxima TaxID=3661 RepID=A0A6J1I817_CUCMA|nr:putative two-component response regulator-like APRR6 [Cucurbita maxima]
MANVSMPDMDSFSFLHVLLKMKIVVIFMSSVMNLDVATKALAEGACYFLQKPISKDDLKYVWQHVYRRNRNISKLNHEANCVEKAKYGKESVGIQNDDTVVLSQPTDEVSINNNGSINYQLMSYKEEGQNQPTNSHDTLVASYFEGKRLMDDIEGTSKEKRVIYYSTPTNFGDTRIDEDNRRMKEYYISSDNRSRVVWNVERRRKFSDALNKLGDKCRPKLILKLMNEPSLTLRQVANHLQKYKAQVESMKKGRENKLAPRREASKFNFSVRTQLPLPLVPKHPHDEANSSTKGSLTSFIGGERFRLIAPKPVPSPKLPVSANFANHGLIMLGQNFQPVDSNYNSVPYIINQTTPKVTSSCVFDETQFSDNHLDVVQQDLTTFKIENQEAMGCNGTSEGIQLMSNNMAFPDSTNLDNIAANFGNEGSQQQSAEFDYLLNFLEDDPHEFDSDLNLSDVDKYSEWLKNTVLENRSGPDSFLGDSAENFSTENTQ